VVELCSFGVDFPDFALVFIVFLFLSYCVGGFCRFHRCAGFVLWWILSVFFEPRLVSIFVQVGVLPFDLCSQWPAMAGALHWQQGSCCVFRSMSQKWPLSQSANQSSGTCSICLATRQIHFRDGTIHTHGQVFMLGHDCHMPSGRIIHLRVRPQGRCCSRTCRFSQRGKICQHWKWLHSSLRPSQLKPWAWWSCQLANSLPIWEERSLQPQAKRGKELFCSAESFGAGATLSFYMTRCQPLTARIDDLHPILYYLNF